MAIEKIGDDVDKAAVSNIKQCRNLWTNTFLCQTFTLSSDALPSPCRQLDSFGQYLCNRHKLQHPKVVINQERDRLREYWHMLVKLRGKKATK